MPGPLSRRSRGVHMPVSSSTSSAFPVSLAGSASRVFPSKRFHDGSLFRDCSHFLCSGPQVCSPPRSFLPLRLIAAGQPRLLYPSRTCFVASACIGSANHLPRQLVVWGLTPHEIHSLVGCSSVIGMFQQLSTTELLSPLNANCFTLTRTGNRGTIATIFWGQKGNSGSSLRPGAASLPSWARR